MSYPKTWFSYLHLAELWYNTSFHSSIKTTPFEATYGRPPPAIVTDISSSDKDAKDALSVRSDMLQKIKYNLQKAQAAMKKEADKHRRPVSFNVKLSCSADLQQTRWEVLRTLQSSGTSGRSSFSFATA